MQTRSTFETLARSAAYVGSMAAVSYRTDVCATDGTCTPASDTQHDFDAGYDDFVESHKWWPHQDLICWEIASDGSAVDVTDRMIYEHEQICEQRGIDPEWGE